MPRDDEPLLAGLHVPHLDLADRPGSAVAAARALPSGENAGATTCAGVPLEARMRRAGRAVPDLDRAIVAGRDEQPAVGAEDQGADGPDMIAQGGDFPAARRLPQPDGTIGPGGSEPAVEAKGDRQHRPGVPGAGEGDPGGQLFALRELLVGDDLPDLDGPVFARRGERSTVAGQTPARSRGRSGPAEWPRRSATNESARSKMEPSRPPRTTRFPAGLMAMAVIRSNVFRRERSRWASASGRPTPSLAGPGGSLSRRSSAWLSSLAASSRWAEAMRLEVKVVLDLGQRLGRLDLLVLLRPLRALSLPQRDRPTGR